MKKSIKNYEELYEITEDGKVIILPKIKRNRYGLYKTKQKETYGYKNKKGYMVVNLVSNKKKHKEKKCYDT